MLGNYITKTISIFLSYTPFIYTNMSNATMEIDRSDGKIGLVGIFIS